MMRKVLSRFPTVKSALGHVVNASRFRQIEPADRGEVTARLSAAWLDEAVPQQQLLIVEPQIAAYRLGHPDPVFDALAHILLHSIPEPGGKSLLEIGCSSGYYSEVLERNEIKVLYRGCDLSPAFINLARRLYPLIEFDVEDATSLSYSQDQFDIVVSGCCLLHIAEYEKAISEAARVAKEFVVFHRTPVLHMTGPISYTKRAYGVEMLEIHFNEQQLVRLFQAHKLQVVDINSHLSLPAKRGNDTLFYKTYLCRKMR